MGKSKQASAKKAKPRPKKKAKAGKPTAQRPAQPRKRANTVVPAELVVREERDGFSLTLNGEVLRTTSGEVRHKHEWLLRQMRSQYIPRGPLEVNAGRIVEPRFLGFYSLYGIQKDWVEHGRDDISADFASCLLQDPLLHLPAGPEAIEVLARVEPVRSWLGSGAWQQLKQLEDEVNELTWRANSGDMPSDAEIHSARTRVVIGDLAARHRELEPAGKAIVQMLWALHGCSLLAALGLATYGIGPSEFADCVTAAKCMITAFGDVRPADELAAYESALANAHMCLDYVDSFDKA